MNRGKEICDNLEEIFGSDSEVLLLELESILDATSIPEVDREATTEEAIKRGWL